MSTPAQPLKHALPFTTVVIVQHGIDDLVMDLKSKQVMAPEPAIVRHHEFYFSDGSVVIIVERTAFRVHQSILARHSEVFNGLWEVPQPSRMEVYDGCPSMHLSGDSVDDFVDVMRVIYDVL
ncbi:hypothetical protein M413DRAFT_32915 [Hebeloma cylindrosporum]|uniref:BTB domain-containing protein n=1 Tax=Hebeloma cylindrosporum TaxID=76867 RepID=A0A0C2Y1E5_HEBCY|nr:hypothetical protein M413DRAFT_32915 [Hebeloma cylindrosporum h7]